MDFTEIITAGITAVAAVAGSALMQNKATAVLQVKMDSLKEDLAKLSLRVDKHNSVQDRILKAECKIEEMEKQFSNKQE